MRIGFAPRRRALGAGVLAAVLVALPVAAQMQLAPLPPERPFDLDLPATPILLPIPASMKQEPEPGPDSPAAVEPDEDLGPEWPQLTPEQKAGAEPQYDPAEKPEKPGVSTDPGTSIACLPPVLKGVLVKLVDRFGAVKVTSTWRPPWRARRGSYHKRCHAMDFRVPGVRPRSVLEFAKALEEVGGHKVYWNGIIHIDTGPAGAGEPPIRLRLPAAAAPGSRRRAFPASGARFRRFAPIARRRA